jgi:hypothetical protein
MAHRRIRRLLVLNDTRLSAFLEANDEESRHRELERILEEHVRPIARSSLTVQRPRECPVAAQDVDDLVSQITLRMIRKLRAALVMEEESVQHLEAYVVTLARNVMRDLMRQRSPGRMRVRSRLRYLLTHDERLALWNYDGVAFAGLASQAGSSGRDLNPVLIETAMAKLPAAPDRAGEAAISLCTSLGPIPFPRLIAVFMQLWNIRDDARQPDSEQVAPAIPGSRFDWNQYLTILWSEVRQLPPRQQSALLLNLRAPGCENAVVLFIAAGVACFDEIAEALGMTTEQLAETWDELPVDDLTIASTLGLTRQQVINLRKCARERLTRRMAVHSRPDQ